MNTRVIEIQSILENDVLDISLKIKEVQRICGDDLIESRTDKEIKRMREGSITSEKAAKSIDDDAEYWRGQNG